MGNVVDRSTTSLQPGPHQPQRLHQPLDSGLALLRTMALRAWAAWRHFNDEQSEVQERMLLLQRPWEEEYLHLAFNGEEWELHGTRPPHPGRGRRSVTASGWCPGLAAHRDCRTR